MRQSVDKWIDRYLLTSNIRHVVQMLEVTQVSSSAVLTANLRAIANYCLSANERIKVSKRMIERQNTSQQIKVDVIKAQRAAGY